MATQRNFHAQEKDPRIPSLLHIISSMLSLQRAQGVPPKCIIVRADMISHISTYMGSLQVRKLFGVPVCVDTNLDAMPFVIVADTDLDTDTRAPGVE